MAYDVVNDNTCPEHKVDKIFQIGQAVQKTQNHIEKGLERNLCRNVAVQTYVNKNQFEEAWSLFQAVLPNSRTHFDLRSVFRSLPNVDPKVASSFIGFLVDKEYLSTRIEIHCCIHHLLRGFFTRGGLKKMIEVFESLTSVLPQSYSHGYFVLERCIESNALGETQRVYQWLIEATSDVDATFQMFAALVFSGNKEEAINIAKEFELSEVRHFVPRLSYQTIFDRGIHNNSEHAKAFEDLEEITRDFKMKHLRFLALGNILRKQVRKNDEQGFVETLTRVKEEDIKLPAKFYTYLQNMARENNAEPIISSLKAYQKTTSATKAATV